MADWPYSIPHRRELTLQELELLRFVLQREAPQRLAEVESLYVVARCGCGKCPAVMLAASPDSEPKTGDFKEIANYLGRNPEGALVGVALLEREGQLSELEAWSAEGVDIASWPPASVLRPLNEKRT